MKTYSIGRDLNCDIVINDSTDVISRRHALLNVMPSGKMTIIDQSSNGTYVNGIRISPNVPFPVSRKDIVSLAHVSKLDWNRIPRGNEYMRYALYGLAGVLVLVCIFFGYNSIMNNQKKWGNDINYVLRDSVQEKEKARYLDSLRQIRQADSLYLDSIKKVAKQREDSIAKMKQAASKKKVRKSDSSKKSKAKSDDKAKSKQDLG